MPVGRLLTDYLFEHAVERAALWTFPHVRGGHAPTFLAHEARVSFGHLRSITEALPCLAGMASLSASDGCGNVIQEVQEFRGRTAAKNFPAILAPKATE
jgi:hypothetical protein